MPAGKTIPLDNVKISRYIRPLGRREEARVADERDMRLDVYPPRATLMHIDPYIVLGAAVVGFLVGMTGAGGGALMTPMLILLFGVTPSHAISSDLVAAVVMRPVGATVHLRKGTVNRKLVGWLVLGSVPMAFLGAYLLHVMGNSKSAQTNVETVLGAALLVGAAAMVLRYTLDLRSGEGRYAFIQDIVPRPVRTVAIGMIGGIVVGHDLGRLRAR